MVFQKSEIFNNKILLAKAYSNGQPTVLDTRVVLVAEAFETR